MSKYIEAECEECSTELLQLEGEYYCPSCDSISGFELIPERDEFKL